MKVLKAWFALQYSLLYGNISQSRSVLDNDRRPSTSMMAYPAVTTGNDEDVVKTMSSIHSGATIYAVINQIFDIEIEPKPNRAQCTLTLVLAQTRWGS